MTWGLQKVRDDKNMSYLPRKATGNEQSQPSREVIKKVRHKYVLKKKPNSLKIRVSYFD